MSTIKLGFAPTRRSIFSAPDAVKYRGLTAERLRELGVDFVDIGEINEEGLLYSEDDEPEYELDDLGEDEDCYATTCPTCEESIYFDESVLEDGEVICPNCGEKLEFDLESLDEDEADDGEE